MKKNTKKAKFLNNLMPNKKIFEIEEGIELLKKMAISKFNESIDASINLGINPKKPDQNIKNSIVLPFGTGKTIKLAVFTTGENINIAKKLGAEYVGLHDLVEQIKEKKIKFDIAIASTDTMKIVNELGPILGPRGLMPNPKLGTVTDNIENAIKNAKYGQINYKNDKNGIVHTTIGKINFPNKDIQENLNALLTSLKKLRPLNLKGEYIKKVTISTTMSLGINIDFNNIT
ncbi:50S ribosomal protein L1 [Buchnera aphidicola (Schlechtendalia chinensis)]|uniref:Large ribosomal subunit protein uL1 n=1 Tax=Buchnera aphidicola subsp. Schlechtendalia chinensis TaxID=118110 RepID=A0A172WD24_BUCSC|nr:50S ribosomal protein L1 [Buchnera aphidicola]ANF16861.1 50S ribosomal protein L1 [Buchnera aphidicola (Schlechtendalia chinensis)]